MSEEQKPNVADTEKTDKSTEHQIPKTRFDEVNKALKEAKAQLEKVETDRKAEEEKRLREKEDFKALADKVMAEKSDLLKLFEQEKAVADQHREYRKAKIEAFKEQMGDDWLPEYESFSLESLEKLVGKQSKVGVDARGPQKVTPKSIQEKIALAYQEGRTIDAITLKRELAEQGK